MLVNGIIMFLVGVYFWYAAHGDIKLHKDPGKNAKALEKFGPIGRALAPIVMVGGGLMIALGIITGR